MVDFQEAHLGSGKTPASGYKNAHSKGIPHLVVIKIGITAVEGYQTILVTPARLAASSIVKLSSRSGAVVYTRQDMAMNVTHRSALIN